MLVQSAERNGLRIMNTFFKKRKNRKWTWKGPNGRKKNEIDFIMCEQPGIIQDTEVVAKTKCSDHRLLRTKIVLNIKKVRTKLVARKRANLEIIKAKNEEFKASLQNRFDALDENNKDLEVVNKAITEVILQTATEVGCKATKQDLSKLSQSTKDLIKNVSR